MQLQASRVLLPILLVLLVLNFVWPRSVLPSLMVTPFLMGACTVSLFGLAFRPALPKLVGAWLALTVLAIGMGPQPEPLALIALASVAACAWITIGLGQQFESNRALVAGVIWALVVGMALNVVVAWLQYFDVERVLYPLVSQNDSSRPYGSLRQANHLATFSVIGLLGVWWLYRMSSLSMRAMVCLTFMAFSGLALSGSRTGLLELVVLSAFLLLWRKTAKPWELGIFVLAPLWVILLTEFLQVMAVWLGLALEGIRGRDTVSARLLYWREAWDLAVLHPIAGVGWGNLGAARLWELPFNPSSANTTNAHNLVLHLLAETGFTTTFLVLAPIAWVLWKRPPWRMVDVNAQWAWMLIAVMVVHSLLEYPLWYMNFLIPTAFAFGVLLSAESTLVPPPNSLPKRLTMLIASLVLFTSLLALFDYLRVADVFGEDNRASADLTRVAAIQNTYLYRYYADRALVERVLPTTENASEMLKVTDRMLNQGPNPIVLWVRLEILCRMGDTLHAKETAALYARVFPASHAEFMQVNGPAVLSACGLVPNLSTSTP